jgi:serine/threonine protein kinase
MPVIGTKIGSYEITALIGKGGMGEVYRAQDTRLKRDVAIKILPDEFSRDPDRLARFQREAEVLASLNHPRIAAIHDLQQVNGSSFLILELVESETLAEHMARGPLPVEEALRIARQIAEALEAAHAKGIIHRDLKPENVKIKPDGGPPLNSASVLSPSWVLPNLWLFRLHRSSGSHVPFNCLMASSGHLSCRMPPRP